MRASDVSRMPTLAVVFYSDALGAISAFLSVFAVKWLSHVLPLSIPACQATAHNGMKL